MGLGRNPQIGRIKIQMTATCHKTDAENSPAGMCPRIQCARRTRSAGSSASRGGRGPVKKARRLDANSLAGRLQCTAKSTPLPPLDKAAAASGFVSAVSGSSVCIDELYPKACDALAYAAAAKRYKLTDASPCSMSRKRSRRSNLSGSADFQKCSTKTQPRGAIR